MNTNKYAVSIILPCYNVAQYIERAIDSILIQDFKDYEIIIINDGSTDNLLQKCSSLNGLLIKSEKNCPCFPKSGIQKRLSCKSRTVFSFFNINDNKRH